MEGDMDVLTVRQSKVLKSFVVTADAHPAVPSDVQPLLMLLALCAHGTSEIRDRRFPQRYYHVPRLRGMGAKIHVQSGCARVSGPQHLMGAAVDAHDIRTGMTLLLAGLSADGETEVTSPDQIERGYDSVFAKLRALDAAIHI
jgi:UDP-N-acetylglucosamine 1-carboxyvinyltransferase